MAPGQLYQLAVRTDGEFVNMRKWLDNLDASGWCVREYVEGEDNEHWHWYIETKLKAASFRVELKRKAPGLKGNGSYSVAEVRDEQKYLQYMAKGPSKEIMCEVDWTKGLRWTDEKIIELHDAYWEVNAKIKKRKAGSIADHVIDICKEQRVEWSDRRTIAKEYIKELVAQSKPINLFSMKANVNLIQVKLCPNDDAIDELAAQVHI